MHNLFNLRKKYNIEIHELTKILNNKYGTRFEVYEIWEWENNKKQPKMREALILADFFQVSYQEFLISYINKLKQSLDDVNIRK